jgi:asparagine synthase (glutamine-hydrolysing)
VCGIAGFIDDQLGHEQAEPLLDQELAAYVAALPSSVRTRGGALKHLLKRVAADVLPPSILARPKRGFGIPLQQWFRGNWRDYAHDVLHGSPSAQRGVFRRGFVDQLLSSHARSSLAGHGNALWALICLELWFQTYLDHSPAPVGRSTSLQAQGRHQTGGGSRG